MTHAYKIKYLSFLLFQGLIALSFSTFSQQTLPAKDTVVLEGFISAEKTLTSDKIYLVRYNVKVGKSATLNVNAGTTVLFDPNTAIVLEGGLNLNGSPNNFIEFSSRDANAPGNGINIRGDDGADINIKYAYFKGLILPLRFEPEWYRKNVTIEKNVFTELYSGESAVLITTPMVDYKPGVDNTINFSFSYNAFYKNWGSIFIENFEDNIMKLKFNNNLVASNVVYGIDIGIPSNTPVFGLFDDLGSEHKVEMQGNSIFGNYQINSATDTVIREISVGIQGDGREFSIPNNFFRSKNADYIYSTFDHFYQNSDLPLLKAEPFLTEPKEETPPHIWKVKINGNEIQDYDDLPENLEIRDARFDVYFNKPVSAFDKTQLEAISYDSIAGSILKNPVTLSQIQWSGDRKQFSFVVSNASFLRDPFTFLILSHFKDQEGFVAPNFQIGQRKAINRYKIISTGLGKVNTGDLMNQRQGIINVNADGGASFLPDEKSVKTIEALTDFGGLSALGPYRSLTKTWEVGVILGVSNYMGTLTYKLVDKNDFHFAAGLFGQYNVNKWISLRAMLWYGRISGSDSDDPDPDRHMRHFNFRNDLVEGSLTFHWHLLKYGVSRGEKFTPTIFAGVSIFRNKPMGRIFLYERDFDPGFGENYGEPVYLTYKDGQFLYDGSGKEVWVSLREIGTEGQTQEFGTDPEADPLRNSPHASLFTDHQQPKQYKKVQVAFPIGFSLDYIIYNKWVISAEIGVRISTTKYLDDIGGYYWDRGSNWVFGLDGGRGLLSDPNTGIPIDAHQSIIDANPEIWAKVDGEKILLPSSLQFTDPNNGITTEYYTAALLANPSLVDIDERVADPDYTRPTNDAFTFNNAKRANPKSKDHFAFIGVKVSKVIPNGKERKKYKKAKKKDAFVDKTNVKDNDKDGLSDADEKIAGTNPKNYDTDGDLLSDGEEVNQFKSDPLKKDTDGDGLDDGKEVRETETDPTLTDTDGDGLDDGKEVNVIKSNPTVFDTDNGGIGDGEEVNNYKTNPLSPADDPIDSDGDGILDSQDDCPKVAGSSKFKGCPDTDQDGIEDSKDRCPYEAGVASNEGCPEVKPEEIKKEVEENLQQLFKNIEFDTNKDVIRSVSFDDMDKAAEILNKNTNYDVIIEGHTDNVGNAAANKTLSQKRAEAVKKYLISKGIASSRIAATGYGAERPKVSNDNESGRQANRRVEIRLIRQ
ncbi:MAG: DUF6089 family protein [Chitinophagales bacterium]|nr:DUF6089 family protein [Chitinophagales bacterium]